MLSKIQKDIENEIRGSGLDYQFNWDVVNNRLRLKTYWHVMNDAGYYIGATPVTVWFDIAGKREFSVRVANTGECFGLRDVIIDRVWWAIEKLDIYNDKI